MPIKTATSIQHTEGQIKRKAGQARCRFSQKLNKRICFVCCEKQKSKQNKLVPSFFGRIHGAPTCLWFYLRPFFLGCEIGGVRIWQGVEIFPQHAVFIAQHAVFIAQQMLDQILRICKSFLKSGFFGHIWFLLFQNQSSYIYNNKLFCSL